MKLWAVLVRYHIFTFYNFEPLFLGGWKVLVMDDVATRVISSALTMYDIMERRVTLVERLAMNRQPFPDMDVLYVSEPTAEAARRISADFDSKGKGKYGNVHLFFLDTVS
jgi:hypothetical protein